MSNNTLTVVVQGGNNLDGVATGSYKVISPSSLVSLTFISDGFFDWHLVASHDVNSRVVDTHLKVVENFASALTTPAENSVSIFSYQNCSYGKSYGVDVTLTAQSTSSFSTGSIFAKLSGHYTLDPAGMMPPYLPLLQNVFGMPTVVSSSNHVYLTASLSASQDSIIVVGSQGASSEVFRWGCFIRVQEQGS